MKKTLLLFFLCSLLFLSITVKVNAQSEERIQIFEGTSSGKAASPSGTMLVKRLLIRINTAISRLVRIENKIDTRIAKLKKSKMKLNKIDNQALVLKRSLSKLNIILGELKGLAEVYEASGSVGFDYLIFRKNVTVLMKDIFDILSQQRSIVASLGLMIEEASSSARLKL